ncbi:hypothetical protein AWV79_05565 [Cupriavidus sp. UYMMa02A]|nr:hypothetical protein AWV79_05565 [Cupriavidus sp. UYMMa02A]
MGFELCSRHPGISIECNLKCTGIVGVQVIPGLARLKSSPRRPVTDDDRKADTHGFIDGVPEILAVRWQQEYIVATKLIHRILVCKRPFYADFHIRRQSSNQAFTFFYVHGIFKQPVDIKYYVPRQPSHDLDGFNDILLTHQPGQGNDSQAPWLFHRFPARIITNTYGQIRGYINKLLLDTKDALYIVASYCDDACHLTFLSIPLDFAM